MHANQIKSHEFHVFLQYENVFSWYVFDIYEKWAGVTAGGVPKRQNADICIFFPFSREPNAVYVKTESNAEMINN